MSYILDALKKAERERGIKQVPTLMTEHAPRTVHRNRIGAVLGILVVCIAMVAWLLLHSQKATIPPPQKSEFSSERPSGTTHTPEAPAASIQHAAPEKKPVESARRANQANAEGASIQPKAEEEDNQIPETVRNRLRSNASSAAPVSAQSQPASLQEALNKMTLSLLLFADTKAERMVFINGKKYAEGDYIDGIYLLESITLDGAILSYRGESALLRPKSK
jgi:general secretion pathway protein B